MKVLHVTPYMHPLAGGPPVVVDRMCSHLQALGIESDILTTDLLCSSEPSEDFSKWQSAARIKVFPRNVRTGYAFSPDLNSYLSDVCDQYDIVHLHTIWTYLSLAVARNCRKKNIPFVVMPHGMLDPESMKRKSLKKSVYGQLVEFPLIKSASGMIYTDIEEERLAHVTCSGLPQGFTVPLGADSQPGDVETLRRDFFTKQNALQGKKIVLFLSRLHEKKGLNLLIPAIALVKDPNIVLLIVGSGEADYEQYVHHLITKFDMQSKIKMTGNLSGSEKWQAMAAASVFILPSYQENFSLVTVDAMAIGLPVILSDKINIAGKIVAAGAGIVCKLESEDIAARIDQLLMQPELCKNMSRAGMTLVSESFTWKKCAETLLTAYEVIKKS